MTDMLTNTRLECERVIVSSAPAYYIAVDYTEVKNKYERGPEIALKLRNGANSIKNRFGRKIFHRFHLPGTAYSREGMVTYIGPPL